MSKRTVKLVFQRAFLEAPTFKDSFGKEIEIEIPSSIEGNQVHLIAARVMTERNEPGLNAIPHGDISATLLDYRDFKNLLGQLLTYIDATFSDQEQRKAHKDIVKEKVWQWERDIRDRGFQTVDAHFGKTDSNEPRVDIR